MGTFAFSSHVKSQDNQAVTGAIVALLGEQGYAPVEEPPEKGKKRGRSALRGIWLTAAHNGWVSLLDSDIQKMHGLTVALSSRLSAWGLIAHVNDSDSWGYTLVHDGAEVDAFDSLGEHADEPPEIDMPTMQGLQNINENLRKVQESMEAAMPPDIRAIKQNLSRRAAAPADINRYMEWMMTAMRQTLDKTGISLPGINTGLGKRAPEQVSRHAELLSPLLPDGVTLETLVEVMRRQEVFMEGVLSEFFRTLGIRPDFAHWSYDSLSQEQGGPADVGLPVVLHLSFGRASLRAARGQRQNTKGSTKKRKASPAPDDSGDPTVLSFAERLVQAFVDAGDPLTAWLEAARHGAIEHLRARLAAGYDVNTRSENGMTALMFAASGGQAQAMQLLIGAGADVNAVDADGNTALMWAVMGSGVIQTLLDASANLQIQRVDGKTALAIAVEYHRAPTVEMLRRAGAQE